MSTEHNYGLTTRCGSINYFEAVALTQWLTQTLTLPSNFWILVERKLKQLGVDTTADAYQQYLIYLHEEKSHSGLDAETRTKHAGRVRNVLLGSKVHSEDE